MPRQKWFPNDSRTKYYLRDDLCHDGTHVYVELLDYKRWAVKMYCPASDTTLRMVWADGRTRTAGLQTAKKNGEVIAKSRLWLYKIDALKKDEQGRIDLYCWRCKEERPHSVDDIDYSATCAECGTRVAL